jgi:carboxymethylenebutenolidase
MFAALHPEAVRAVVAFYAAPHVGEGNNSTSDPRPDMITFVPKIQCPIQCHFGTKDVVIPLADVEKFEEEVTHCRLDAEIYRYEGAEHGFYHYMDGESYDPAASKQAHQRMITFLKKHIPT